MSAIDWLSDSLTAPPRAPNLPAEPDVSTGATVEDVTVQPLGLPMPDAVGLLPVSVTGLPRGLWGGPRARMTWHFASAKASRTCCPRSNRCSTPFCWPNWTHLPGLTPPVRTRCFWPASTGCCPWARWTRPRRFCRAPGGRRTPPKSFAAGSTPRFCWARNTRSVRCCAPHRNCRPPFRRVSSAWRVAVTGTRPF